MYLYLTMYWRWFADYENCIPSEHLVNNHSNQFSRFLGSSRRYRKERPTMTLTIPLVAARREKIDVHSSKIM